MDIVCSVHPPLFRAGPLSWNASGEALAKMALAPSDVSSVILLSGSMDVLCTAWYTLNLQIYDSFKFADKSPVNHQYNPIDQPEDFQKVQP